MKSKFCELFSLAQNLGEILWKIKKCQIYPGLKLSLLCKLLTFFALLIEGGPNPLSYQCIFVKTKSQSISSTCLKQNLNWDDWSYIYITLQNLSIPLYLEPSKNSAMMVVGCEGLSCVLMETKWSAFVKTKCLALVLGQSNQFLNSSFPSLRGENDDAGCNEAVEEVSEEISQESLRGTINVLKKVVRFCV